MHQLTPELKVEGTSREREAVRTWLRLLSCERSIEQALRSHLSENFDVTLPQFEVLCELHRHDEPVAMSRVSEKLHVTSSNLTGVVDRLVRKDLVQRFRSREDRRVQFIAMTPEGLSMYETIEADNALWVTRVFAELTIEELRALQGLLIKASMSANRALA